MMKKVLSLLLALCLCLSLCACGESEENNSGTNTKATIKTKEGKTVDLSAADLFNECDSNEARFAKIYCGATIEFVGTVKYIKAGTDVYNGKSITTEQNKIVFEEGWCLIIGSENTTYDLADYYPGQKLKVSTGIVSAAFDTPGTQLVADNNRVVWLAGNDKLWGTAVNTQTTTISVVE